MPRLSILDLSPVAGGRGEAAAVRESIELAVAAERLGYHRIWFAEHHNGAMLASSAPEIMIASVAARTERIRVGSGGMMLPNHTPLHLAEQFKVLEALYPGRIDLGIGRAPGTDYATSMALRGGREPGGKDFPELLAQMQAFSGNRDWPAGHPFSSTKAAPDDVPLPPVTLLGSSDFSARLAAEAGFQFSFAGQINPSEAIPMLRLYRENFKPSATQSEPYAILAHNAIAAETADRARELAASARVAFRRLRQGIAGPLPSPEEAATEDRPMDPSEPIDQRRVITGTGTEVREMLDELQSRSGADEVMVMASTYDVAERIRSYELLAEAYGLEAAEASAAATA